MFFSKHTSITRYLHVYIQGDLLLKSAKASAIAVSVALTTGISHSCLPVRLRRTKIDLDATRLRVLLVHTCRKSRDRSGLCAIVSHCTLVTRVERPSCYLRRREKRGRLNEHLSVFDLV
jgi:post-segregation antitoxin (ccd killing protein)